MDRLTAMTVFRKVVEKEGFAAAARELKLSTGAVSKHVGMLESHLGVRLLNRTTRRLALTEAGRLYYERCARLLDELGDLEGDVGAFEAQPRGTLKVNAPMSFGVTAIAALLPEFLARYPEITIDLTLNDRMVDLIEEGFDLVVRIRTAIDDSSLIGRRVGAIGQILCAAPDYLARHGMPQSPQDLADHPCLIYSLNTNPGEWLFTGRQGSQKVRVSGPLITNNSHALRPAALAGLGIWRTPDFMALDDLASGRLVEIRFADWTMADHDIMVLYPPGRHLSPKIRAFVDFLASHLPNRCRDVEQRLKSGSEPLQQLGHFLRGDIGAEHVLQPAIGTDEIDQG